MLWCRLGRPSRGWSDVTPAKPALAIGSAQNQRKDSTVDRLDQLHQAIEAIREDYNKAKGGNKAAGTRVRKAMQDIKNLAQEVRQEMLEVRTDA